MPIAPLLDALRGVDNVVYAPPVADEPLDIPRPTGYSTPPAGSPPRWSRPSPPKLFIVTRNAQPVAEGERANPAHAVLWGLGRTLALEHPEIWGGIIDLDDAMPAVLAASTCSRQPNRDGEDQVCYRAGSAMCPGCTGALQTAAPPPNHACRHQPPRHRRDR